MGRGLCAEAERSFDEVMIQCKRPGCGLQGNGSTLELTSCKTAQHVLNSQVEIDEPNNESNLMRKLGVDSETGDLQWHIALSRQTEEQLLGYFPTISETPDLGKENNLSPWISNVNMLPTETAFNVKPGDLAFDVGRQGKRCMQALPELVKLGGCCA